MNAGLADGGVWTEKHHGDILQEAGKIICKFAKAAKRMEQHILGSNRKAKPLDKAEAAISH